jgi:hypothetical protein
MSKDMPRFREPTRADEMTHCRGCDQPAHHSELSEDGLCGECARNEPEPAHPMISVPLNILLF